MSTSRVVPSRSRRCGRRPIGRLRDGTEHLAQDAHELVQLERLGQECRRLLDLASLRPRRAADDDDRRSGARVTAVFPGEGGTVHPGHEEVEEDHVGIREVGKVEPASAVAGDDHAMALL